MRRLELKIPRMVPRQSGPRFRGAGLCESAVHRANRLPMKTWTAALALISPARAPSPPVSEWQRTIEYCWGERPKASGPPAHASSGSAVSLARRRFAPVRNETNGRYDGFCDACCSSPGSERSVHYPARRSKLPVAHAWERHVLATFLQVLK